MILTQKKHLDLVPLHHPILLELILDLLIALLALLLLGTHTTTHLEDIICNLVEIVDFR